MLYTDLENHCVLYGIRKLLCLISDQKTIMLYAELDKTIGLYTEIR